MDDFLGDNPVIRVNGFSLDRLKHAMKLVNGLPAKGWKIHQFPDGDTGDMVSCLVFFRYGSENEFTPLPAPMSADRCADIAFDWLQAVDYPQEMDHDGSNKKGWLLFNSSWGRVDGCGSGSIVALAPQWIMFGK